MAEAPHSPISDHPEGRLNVVSASAVLEPSRDQDSTGIVKDTALCDTDNISAHTTDLEENHDNVDADLDNRGCLTNDNILYNGSSTFDKSTCDKNDVPAVSVPCECQSEEIVRDAGCKAVDSIENEEMEAEMVVSVDCQGEKTCVGVETGDGRSVTLADSDADSRMVDETEQQGNIRLTDLPTELLLLIASYIDSRTIVTGLCQVCQTFNHLFSGDAYWKSRINRRWPKQYPIFERDDFNWQWGCVAREEVHRIWSKHQTETNHFMFKQGFFAAVDVVHLMKGGQFLAVGSRDRHMNIVDLNKYNPDQPEQGNDIIVFSDTKSHKGWVWSMASHDNTLVTGSWDTKIRLWDLGDGDVQMYGQIKLKSAVLGLHYEPGFVAAGGFDKRLMMLDPRNPDDVIIKRYHSQPILSVVADDKYVITASEDRTVSVYDRAAGKNYKKIQMESFALSLSYGDGQLWCGDREGKLHVLDARNGLFDENNMQTFDIQHTGRLSGVVHTDGGVFTSSTDGSLKVIEPNYDPEVICTLSSHTGPVAGLSYCNGTLASAGSDVEVGVWIPKY